MLTGLSFGFKQVLSFALTTSSPDQKSSVSLEAHSDDQKDSHLYMIYHKYFFGYWAKLGLKKVPTEGANSYQ